jgi:hypothetical protein
MTDTLLVVRRFTDRKKPCLCLEQGNKCLVIGTLRNEEMAQLYDDFMGGMCLQMKYKDLFTEGQKNKERKHDA